MFFSSAPPRIPTVQSETGYGQRNSDQPLECSTGPLLNSCEQIQQGSITSSSEDIQALSLLYEAFRRPIYSYAYRLLGNWEDAADVTQEVFLRACLSWERIRGREHLFPWLHHVATNICLDLLRRRKRLSWWPLARCMLLRDKNGEKEEDLSCLLTESGGITEIAEREHIYLTLTQMPVDAMLALVLNAVQGVPYQEVAALLGISPKAAATRISRAKKLFVEQYQRINNDNDIS